MTTLTEFLLARIAEDEEVALHIHAGRCETPPRTVPDSMGRPMSPTCGCDWHITRVLAECAAKRAILDNTYHDPEAYNPEWRLGWNACIEATAKRLALPYADHADYLPEWRP